MPGFTHTVEVTVPPDLQAVRLAAARLRKLREKAGEA